MQNLTSLTQSSAGNVTCAKNFTVTGTLTQTGTGTFSNVTVGTVDTNSSAQLYVKGKGKIHLHDTTNGYCIEAKSNFNGTTTQHFGITSTVEYEPTGGTATAGGVQGLQGVARLAASMTMTGGSLIGTYGQACNLGTINGSGVMVAGLYGLVEDGGTFTSASHVSSLWLDSHLTKAVGGEHELLYMSNNGTVKMDRAIYIYGGTASQGIAALFELNTCTGTSGFVGDKVDADIAFAHYRKIACTVDGTAGWIVMGFDA